MPGSIFLRHGCVCEIYVSFNIVCNQRTRSRNIYKGVISIWGLEGFCILGSGVSFSFLLQLSDWYSQMRGVFVSVATMANGVPAHYRGFLVLNFILDGYIITSYIQQLRENFIHNGYIRGLGGLFVPWRPILPRSWQMVHVVLKSLISYDVFCLR